MSDGMARAEHVPTRLCVGCNGRDARDRLVRFGIAAGALVVDEGGRLAGRGAYLHRAADCRRAFLSRKHSIRSLRASVNKRAREALVATLER